MNETMIERAGRVIYENGGGQMLAASGGAFGYVPPWQEVDPIWKEVFQKTGRAVIEALRETTGEMKDAGAETLLVYREPEGWVPSLDGQPSKAWQAMIDAALRD